MRYGRKLTEKRRSGGGIWATAHLGLGEIDGLLVPPGTDRPSDYWLTAHV